MDLSLNSQHISFMEMIPDWHPGGLGAGPVSSPDPGQLGGKDRSSTSKLPTSIFLVLGVFSERTKFSNSACVSVSVLSGLGEFLTVFGYCI